MHLIQLLLPLHDNDGHAFPANYYSQVREELAERFGGVTAFLRSPAVGLWKESPEEIHRDEVVTFEVLSERLDQDWWSGYRKQLQNGFRQDELLMWATNIRQL